jgi:hypothetical protein
MKNRARFHSVFILASLTLLGLTMSSTMSTCANADELPPEVVERLKQQRIARELVRKENPKLFAAVSNAMFQRDPIGINFKTNTDEYDAEAGTVIPRLKDCSSSEEVATVLHQEFVRWFGAETAGERTRYVELSKDIWALWKRGA